MDVPPLLRSRRVAGDGKDPAIVDLDLALARKSSKNKGRRRTGKNADRGSAAAVAADTSVEAAVAKATNVTGKANKAGC